MIDVYSDTIKQIYDICTNDDLTNNEVAQQVTDIILVAYGD